MNVILYPAISLDGFIARKNGDSDWVSEEDGAIFESEAKKAGCIIVGHRTYDQYKDELYPIKGVKTYVVSRNPEKYEQNDSVCYVLPDAKKICDRVVADGFDSVLIAGGGETNGLFAAASTVDAVITSVYPLVLGDGIKLFGSYSADMELNLVSSQPLSNGVVQNHYEVIK